MDTKKLNFDEEQFRLDHFEPCGCGKGMKYLDVNGNAACNKYLRCLNYEESQAALRNASYLLQAYRLKRSVDGLNGRKWDARKHLEAEMLIEKLENNQQLTK